MVSHTTRLVCYAIPRSLSREAALPIANTRPQRSSLAATTAAMQNSVQRDAATTRLGGKKKTYQN
eukprot:scaffold102707_cov67-Phaeocystis_antarctica.AAC.2